MRQLYRFCNYDCSECGKFRCFVSFDEIKDKACPTCNKKETVTLDVPKRYGKAPVVIGDEMNPTWHPCDGKKYESKSEFRRVTKAHGKIEVGNDFPTAEQVSKKREENFERATQDIENDIGEAARELL